MQADSVEREGGAGITARAVYAGSCVDLGANDSAANALENGEERRGDRGRKRARGMRAAQREGARIKYRGKQGGEAAGGMRSEVLAMLVFSFWPLPESLGAPRGPGRQIRVANRTRDLPSTRDRLSGHPRPAPDRSDARLRRASPSARARPSLCSCCYRLHRQITLMHRLRTSRHVADPTS